MKSTARHYIRLILNIVVPVLGLLLLFLAVPKLLIFFLPFVLGYFVAFLANPLVTFLQKKISLKRKHSSIFISIAVLALVIFLLYLLISRLLVGAWGFIVELPAYYDAFILAVKELFAEYKDVLAAFSPELVETVGSLSENLNAAISELLTKLAASAPSIAGNSVKSAASIFINALIFFLSAFCFITEWENIQNFIRKHTPKAVADYITYLKQDVKNIFSSWLLAQFKIMFVVFAVLSAGFLLLSVKYALPLAALTAFLDFLPAFGVGFILWPWILFSVLKGEFFMAAALAALYLLTQAVRQILQPKIMGDTMGLPPLWTLFFLFVGFKLYGIAGMLFSVPIGMFFLSIYRYGLFDNMIGAVSEFAADINRLMKKENETEKNETASEPESKEKKAGK